MINKEESPKIQRLDSIIEQLLRGKSKSPFERIQLKIDDIQYLIFESKKIIKSQPAFLELSGPVSICGDIHGQFYDLLRIFEFCGHPPKTSYLFLGDYVDRGSQNIETICLLLAYKIKFPVNFFLLRGNHESSTINWIYGFYDECRQRYSYKLWKQFGMLFDYFPLMALVEEKILCMHGGLSPELFSLESLQKIQRPLQVPDQGLVCDVLWSDPVQNIQGWSENERGVSYCFGSNIVKKFLESQDLDLICRGHQVVEDGYEFFANWKLVTVFSAPNYCGEFDNSAAVLSVSENLECSFRILEPI